MPSPTLPPPPPLRGPCRQSAGTTTRRRSSRCRARGNAPCRERNDGGRRDIQMPPPPSLAERTYGTAEAAPYISAPFWIAVSFSVSAGCFSRWMTVPSLLRAFFRFQGVVGQAVVCGLSLILAARLAVEQIEAAGVPRPGLRLPDRLRRRRGGFLGFLWLCGLPALLFLCSPQGDLPVVFGPLRLAPGVFLRARDCAGIQVALLV